MLHLSFCDHMTMGNYVASCLCFSPKTTNDDDEEDEPLHEVEFVGGNVYKITSEEIWEQKLEEASRDNKIVIANFSASWCGPCRMVAPFYCELSEKHPSLMFLLVDVDELEGLSSTWDVRATPTFFFLKDGKQFETVLGANKPELEKKITDIVDNSEEDNITADTEVLSLSRSFPVSP